jgi:hypothetical protein
LGSLFADLRLRRDTVENTARLKSIQSDVATLRADRDRITRLADERLRLQLLATIDGQLSGLLTAVVGTPEQGSIEQLAKSWREETALLADRIRDRDHLSYQAWALKQMAAFEPAFEKCKSYLGDDYKCQGEAMISHLCAVDERLLEAPIQTRFTQLWSGAFSELDESNKKSVLEHVSKYAKRALGETP